MKKLKEHKKFILILVLSIVGVASIIGGTYAVFFDEKVASNPTDYTTGILSITGTGGSSLNLSKTVPMNDDDGEKLSPYTFTITNNGNLPYKFNVKLLSTSSTTFSPEYIKIQVDENKVTTLSELTNSIVKKDVILMPDSSIDIKIRVWLSIDTPNTEIGKVFNSQIVTDGEAVYKIPTLASKKITDLYTNAEKTVVTNNNIEYNYASTVSLMNDRLGGETESLDGGNIRYYGANPNNYIYFNCNDYTNQSDETCEKWRIIGVFDNKLKIVRNESIGSYSWDYKVNGSSTSYSNDWSTATLNTLLNSTYYNAGTANYYNNSNVATTVDFTSIGLKNDEARSVISEVSWGIRKFDSNDIYSDQIYKSEIGTNTYSENQANWIGKIALMYLSDYSYATDFTKCNQTLVNYNSSTNSYGCRSNDWLYNAGSNEWLLTTDSNNPTFGWYMYSYDFFIGINLVNTKAKIRPTLYLNSETTIESGDGSDSSPFRINVS